MKRNAGCHGITFEDLVNETLKYNLLPCVIPEFKSITIGGAIQGIAIESSSFIYGTFDKTILNAKLITGNGQIINSNDNLRLWNGIPGSNGTIALIASARIQLIDATKWIHLKYTYHSKVTNFFESVEKIFASRNPFSWIDKKRESLGMLQDIDISRKYTENILHWAGNKGLDKIWLCPIRSFQMNESLFNVAKSNEDFIMNIGLYGNIQDLPQSNIELQKLVCRFNGKIALYAHIYLTKEDFWNCYNYNEYLYLRKTFHGFVFMDLWEKVSKITFSKITNKY
ncbi:hypothetical protein I4U23_017498 [Adineta vaga]|nr:hypothetical protein I4U23_017498 [Adineta vaga]